MTEFNPWLFLLTQTDFYASMFKRYYEAFTNSASVTKALQYINYVEGGRVGILIQVVNDNGGITVIPETHTDLIMYSQQRCLRPIVDPVPTRTISLAIRSDFIHEAKLNAVADAIKHIIPGGLLEKPLLNGRLVL